jgi:hypothetical protein
MIRGSSFVGSVRDLGEVTVAAITLKDAATGSQHNGILIQISEAGNDVNRSNAYVDYSEIDGLLAGLEYISKVDHRATPLERYQAIFSTKGDLRVTVIGRGATPRRLAISAGHRGAGFEIDHIKRFTALVVRAKAVLDSPESYRDKAALEPAAKAVGKAKAPAKAAPKQPTGKTDNPLKLN